MAEKLTRASMRRRMLKALPKAAKIAQDVTSQLRVARTKGVVMPSGNRAPDHPELDADAWRSIAKKLRVASGMYEAAADASDRAADLIDRGELP